jgi:cytochrome d ubiquinol oxidase subunit II
VSSADLLAGVALLAVIAYAVLAGADFGGGIWDLFAAGPRKEEQRRAIASAMAPVWEANHVWLIFVIVLLFGGFPRAFAALSIGLFAPFHLALVGITLRGAAFVFRAYGPEGGKGSWGAIFGAASAITPVLLGMAMGAVSAGSMHVVPDGPYAGIVETRTAWLAPISLVTGALALALCAYLAAVYLTIETAGPLREDFRRRAFVAGTVVVILSAVAIPLAFADAPHIAHGLLSKRALPIVIAGVVAALTSGAALLGRRFKLARIATAAQVVFLLAGWGAAQYPYLIYPDLTVGDAAAGPSTLRFFLWSLIPGAALLVPSLWMLFRVFKMKR